MNSHNFKIMICLQFAVVPAWGYGTYLANLINARDNDLAQGEARDEILNPSGRPYTYFDRSNLIK